MRAHLRVCACVCVGACVCAWVLCASAFVGSCVRKSVVCARARVRVRAFVRACMYMLCARTCDVVCGLCGLVCGVCMCACARVCTCVGL